jgi:hypothetical protein
LPGYYFSRQAFCYILLLCFTVFPFPKIAVAQEGSIKHNTFIRVAGRGAVLAKTEIIIITDPIIADAKTDSPTLPLFLFELTNPHTAPDMMIAANEKHFAFANGFFVI